MSITNELREYARALFRTKPNNNPLTEIADSIDKAYEGVLAEKYAKGYEEGFDAGYASADDWYVDHADVLNEHGWVRLPVDADGEPINIGDKLVEPEYVPNGGTVVGMKRYVGWDHWLVNCGAWVDPRKCRHYHEPTVEDVLRDVVTLCHNTWKEGSASKFYDVDDVMSSGNIADLADRIREVVEHERI